MDVITCQDTCMTTLRVIQSVVYACHGVFHTASPVTDNPVSNSLFSICKFYRLEQSIWIQIRVAMFWL